MLSTQKDPAMKKRLVIVLAAILSLIGCDEALPPRTHPLTLDINDYLRVDMEVLDGPVVYLAAPDSGSSAAGGVFVIRVTNIHDEVLQGVADIHVDVTYWLQSFLYQRHAIGDAQNLRNTFNQRGGHFMLQNGILTIEPDSTAILEVQIEHVRDRLWEYGNPVLDTTTGRITTDNMPMSARAEVRLFSGYGTMYTGEVSFGISYIIFATYGGFISILHDRVFLDANGYVVTEWWTKWLPGTIYGFSVEKSSQNTQETFFEIPNGLLDPVEILPPDSVYYSVVDSSTESGTWFYRIAQIEAQGILLVPTGYTFPHRIVVP